MICGYNRKMSKKILAKKVSSDVINEPLKLLAKILNINNNPDIFECDSVFYIDSTSIFQLLDVKKEWFKSNADIVTHYLVIFGKIHINKYGFTKILGQSRESIGRKLQDYIYDVIYRLETNGKVSVQESSDARNNLLNEVKFYKTMHEHNSELAETIKSDFEVLRNDYAVLSEEHETCSERIKNLSLEKEHLLNVSKQLVSAIKVYNEKVLTKGLEKKVRAIPDLDDILDSDLSTVILPRKKAAIDEKRDLYILRYVDKKYYPHYYWKAIYDMSDLDVDEDVFIRISQEFLDGKKEIEFPYIYWRQIKVPTNKMHAMEIIFNNLVVTEAMMDDIIDSFNK